MQLLTDQAGRAAAQWELAESRSQDLKRILLELKVKCGRTSHKEGVKEQPSPKGLRATGAKRTERLSVFEQSSKEGIDKVLGLCDSSAWPW